MQWQVIYLYLSDIHVVLQRVLGDWFIKIRSESAQFNLILKSNFMKSESRFCSCCLSYFLGSHFCPDRLCETEACDYIYACARDPLALPSLFSIEWPWFEEKCFCQLKSVMWLGSILFIINDRLNLVNPTL